MNRLLLANPMGEAGGKSLGPSDASAAERGTSCNAWRVLVADDNQDAGQSLALLLELEGHITAWAQDGHSVLAQVASFHPDMVILDIGMPGLTGHEVAERLRQDPQHQGLVLVALTGWGADCDRARSLRAGFDLHLGKPADPAALLALMKKPAPRRRTA